MAENRIPKIIHYCWFGGNPLPKLSVNCIKSWRKYCPDYEIKEWNEQNFDIASAPPYVQEAYASKKWAFVADYVRLVAMTEYGGIYMDTDVELLKSPDAFLHHEAFTGFETNESISTGLMGCAKGNKMFSEFKAFYGSLHFITEDGSYNLTPNTYYFAEFLRTRGFQFNGVYQDFMGLTVYPKDYFCPKDPWYGGKTVTTKNTVALHYYDGSWGHPPGEARLCKELEQKFRRLLPDMPALYFAYFISKLRYAGVKKAFENIIGVVKKKY